MNKPNTVERVWCFLVTRGGASPTIIARALGLNVTAVQRAVRELRESGKVTTGSFSGSVWKDVAATMVTREAPEGFPVGGIEI